MATSQQSSNSKIQILILDDEPMWQITTQEACKEILETLHGGQKLKDLVRFFTASNVHDAKQILSDNEIQLLLLDKDLGIDSAGEKISGIDHIQEFKSIQPFCQILMLTADNSVREIAQAMRNGASDYLFKNDGDGQKEYRTEVIRKALKLYVDELEKTKTLSSTRKGLYANYVSRSPAMQRLENKLLAVSESSRSVLLLGATGLGKGAVARRISELRRRHLGQRKREFVQINIASTEKNLIDSILFGTEPGAFTGASKHTKAGLLDIAREGDIFIDEVGDASIELQLKLLKVVEEKEYYRVGGTQPIKTKARFIFATNKDVGQLIRDGKFREDFNMRISVFEETLPPLSERKEDIPLILQGFLAAACAESNDKMIDISDFPTDLMTYFLRCDIPGNIRGIENDVERLVAYTKCDANGKPNLSDWKRSIGLTTHGLARKTNTLNVEQLSSGKTNFLDNGFPGLWELTQILERRVLEEVDAKGLSIERAAKLLKVSVNTVWSRKKKFSAGSKGQLQ